MAVSKSQIRLQQITSSLPSSNLGPATELTHESLAETIDALASGIRRLNSYDEPIVGFFQDAQVFKAMGSENRFVVLANQKLFVSSSTMLSGTTEISTNSGLLSVTGNGAGTIDLGARLDITGSSLGIKASGGNFELESGNGTTFTEDGTEVFSISSTKKSRFHINAGTLSSPDVEFDGKVRFDSNVGYSGSISFAKSGNQIIEKNNSGNLILSNSVGRVYFIDSNTSTSTWSDKDLGVPLATSATDWSDFAGTGATSILQALSTGGSANKFSLILSATLPAGNSTGGLNADLSSFGGTKDSSLVDVSVNGQMMHSGSTSQVSAGTADYELIFESGRSNVETRFSFPNDSGDIIHLVIR